MLDKCCDYVFPEDVALASPLLGVFMGDPGYCVINGLLASAPGEGPETEMVNIADTRIVLSLEKGGVEDNYTKSI